MVSHASNPTAEPLGNGRLRVFFSTRDAMNRSHIAAAVFDMHPEPRLIDLSSEPLVVPGDAGTFDDSGASMACLARADGALFLYYLGWNLCKTVPWRNSIGLALSVDAGRSFRKVSAAPIVDRSGVDPYSLSYPWVAHEPGSWKMWYGSNLRWGSLERDMDHVIKYAESKDGIAWQRNGSVAIPLSQQGEYALARPCVLRDGGLYRMWFTHRGAAYRIGYAESNDGLSWRRDLGADVPGVSADGWDSEMITYPCVFDCDGARYMLYNGNRYGRSGFGLALHQ
jgi:hypothetical protein